MRYLLDTNIVSDLVRHPQGPVAAWVAQVGEAAVCTSVIVAAELRFGATKKGSARLTTQLEAVLGALEVLSFEAPADGTYGQVRAELEAFGNAISRARIAAPITQLATMRIRSRTCAIGSAADAEAGVDR